MVAPAGKKDSKSRGTGDLTMRVFRFVGVLFGVVAGLSLVAFAAYLVYVIKLWNEAMKA